MCLDVLDDILTALSVEIAKLPVWKLQDFDLTNAKIVAICRLLNLMQLRASRVSKLQKGVSHPVNIFSGYSPRDDMASEYTETSRAKVITFLRFFFYIFTFVVFCVVRNLFCSVSHSYLKYMSLFVIFSFSLAVQKNRANQISQV